VALVTNIIIDLSAQTASLTITKDAIPIETINFASNQITFLERGDISISGTEFLDLLAQIEIFQTALLKNFPLNIFSTIPFNMISVQEINNSLDQIWSLIGLYGDLPNVVEYNAISSSTTVSLAKRSPDKTIFFPEWTYLLFNLSHYRASVKAFLNL
jgi:hypothetical protein